MQSEDPTVTETDDPPYEPPTLTVLGDLAGLTQTTGSSIHT